MLAIFRVLALFLSALGLYPKSSRTRAKLAVKLWAEDFLALTVAFAIENLV